MNHALSIVLVALSFSATGAASTSGDKVDPRRKPAVQAAAKQAGQHVKRPIALTPYQQQMRRAHDLNGDGKLGGKEKLAMRQHLRERAQRRAARAEKGDK